jgi:hypothetical protein
MWCWGVGARSRSTGNRVARLASSPAFEPQPALKNRAQRAELETRRAPRKQGRRRRRTGGPLSRLQVSCTRASSASQWTTSTAALVAKPKSTHGPKSTRRHQEDLEVLSPNFAPAPTMPNPKDVQGVFLPSH